MSDKNTLLLNIEKLHTTVLGVERIKRNLDLQVEDVVEWCKEQILKEEATIYKKGKNWYIEILGNRLTVNASSYTIITAHRIKSK